MKKLNDIVICYAKSTVVTEHFDTLRNAVRPSLMVFRNAGRHHGEVEPCDSVVVVGDYPDIVKAYEDAGFSVKQEAVPNVQPEKKVRKAKAKPEEKATPVPSVDPAAAPGGVGDDGTGGLAA